MREELESLSGTRWAGRKLIHFRETDSTNEQAKKSALSGEVHGTLVTADCQSAGKGRRGRSWESPAGSNLYFTLVLKPEFAPEYAPMLTIVMAHAAAEAMRRETGLDCRIKWPNDIVVNGKKVCGILTEMDVLDGKIRYVVIGVGVNVEKQEFPEELAEKATSLEAQLGNGHVCKKALLVQILSCFEKEYEIFAKDLDLRYLKESYENILIGKNERVRVLDPQGEYEGISRGITGTGELLVERDDGQTETVYAGEVSVRGLYGYVR